MTGKEIEKARKKKKWTATELAHRTGLSLVFIRDIELGKRKPSQVNALAIADQLGIPMRICPHCEGTGLLRERTPRLSANACAGGCDENQ